MRLVLAFLFAFLAPGISPVLFGALNTNAFEPGVKFTTNETNGISSAVSTNLAAFKARITQGNRQLMGFDSDLEVQVATNGEPMMVFVMRVNQLTNYQDGKFNGLLASPPATSPATTVQPRLRAFIPIFAGTNIRSAMLLYRSAGPNGTWGGRDWGHPNLIRNLVATWRAIPDAELAPNTVRFVVEIPVPRLWFVGYYDTQELLVLRSTVNLQLGAITIPRHEAVTHEAMEQLAIKAKTHNPNLPN